MGKYLPIIVTADCGSLTRAGKVLGYAQPNMGGIVTRFENELGVKLFRRDQHGVTLTETGQRLMPIMRQIDEMENHLLEVASHAKKERFRVGVFQRVANQWMPQITTEFCKTHPGTVVQMEILDHSPADEALLPQLDCFFSLGDAIPDGMDHIPLLPEPHFLLVPTNSPLADLPSVSLAEAAGTHPFIRSTLEPNWADRLAGHDIIKVSSPEEGIIIALVAQGLGACILPKLSLGSIAPAQPVQAIPLHDVPVQTLHLLFPRQAERPSFTAAFLRLVQKQANAWEQTHSYTQTQ